MSTCNCRSWCRDWSETQGFRFPQSNHAPGCNLYVQEEFTVLEHDGTRCIMEPHEAAAIAAESPGEFTTSTVMLTRDQFNRLPEFEGF